MVSLIIIIDKNIFGPTALPLLSFIVKVYLEKIWTPFYRGSLFNNISEALQYFPGKGLKKLSVRIKKNKFQGKNFKDCIQ